MKISLEWLRDFLPDAPDGPSAAEALTHGGLPVEVIEKHADDTVIDVEVTSNRGDCLSHMGVARELSALLNRPFKEAGHVVVEATTPVGSVTSVQIDAPHLCSHYTARVIRNVKVKPSPDWMKRRLEAVGIRAINNIVDVTNYVMFEMGQPLHAFDFDKLDGRRIVVRAARANETIISIDGHERKLSPDMLVIADASKPVAVAGVMGGRESEVSDSTVNMLLESARFDPLSVRTTSRRLALKSDSSYRFERGIDPTLPMRASLRAAQLILETASGELLSGVAQAGSDQFTARTVSLRLARLNKLLGIEISSAQAFDALKRLQLNPVLHDGRVDVTVPSWRADINIEVDLIEEVARIVGYDKIPIRDEISIRVVPPDPQRKAIDAIGAMLVGGGYFEAVTVTFVSDLLADDFKPADVKLPRADALVRKADARLRPSMLPGLLEVLARNESAGNAGTRLFEIGATFRLDEKTAVDERPRLGIIGGEDLREVRGIVEALTARLDSITPVQFVPKDIPGFERGASAGIEWGGATLGHIGKIDRKIGDKLGLRTLPAAAELNMLVLLPGMQKVPTLKPLPRFPAVRRDLSLVMADSVRFDEIRKLVDQAKPENLEAMEYVGVYRGKPLEKGAKSQTISLVFRNANETLTSQAVDAAVKKVIDAAEQRGFKLRV